MYCWAIKVLLSCQKRQLLIALSIVDFMALSRHVLSTIEFWFVDYMHIFVSFAVDEQVHTPVAHWTIFNWGGRTSRAWSICCLSHYVFCMKIRHNINILFAIFFICWADFLFSTFFSSYCDVLRPYAPQSFFLCPH